jgi:hypothetical protein
MDKNLFALIVPTQGQRGLLLTCWRQQMTWTYLLAGTFAIFF